MTIKVTVVFKDDNKSPLSIAGIDDAEWDEVRDVYTFSSDLVHYSVALSSILWAAEVEEGDD